MMPSLPLQLINKERCNINSVGFIYPTMLTRHDVCLLRFSWFTFLESLTFYRIRDSYNHHVIK